MSDNRLPEPMGLLIDRDHPVSFDFEGGSFTGFQGDTIASALLANQQWLLSRSFKYHRPRGPLTLAGQDANTLVQLGGEPNVLADRESITDGVVVSGQNYSGSLARDRDAYLDSLSGFLPVGFYYRAFFKPKGMWEKWERPIRKKAGLGKLDLTHQPEYYDKQYLFYDVVIVGAGPAGLSAAVTAAKQNVRVLLVDENPLLGGALSYHRFYHNNHDSIRLRNALVDNVAKNERITVFTNAVCNAWFKDNYLAVIQGKRLFKVRAKECIVASGSFEQHVVFRNNDVPGVLMTSAAMRLMHWYAVKPGNTAVVLTVNDDGYCAALTLHEQGVRVAAVVDLRHTGALAEVDKPLVELGIRVISGATVYEAIANQEKHRLQAVDVRKIIDKGRVEPDGETIECDVLCMSGGYMPAYQLLCQAGATLSYSDDHASFALANLPEHLHIAGSVNDNHDLDCVMADGQMAATKALQNLGFDGIDYESMSCERVVNHPWPIFPHPKGKEFVDFDEDLQVRDIINATRLGYRDIQLVKRFSTLGMGPSQGRHSALPAARLVADATDRSVSETGVTTARPPFAPEKLAHLAGRRFDPYRRTAMHQRHVALGAQMMPAGSWQRPAFYGPASMRDECVAAEAVQVRTKVGIIDVSTLGGLEIRGPDAAEFVNRIYTFAFLKQPVGKTRYAIVTSEQGVVIDDGVACRLAEDHFYITATTSGVDRVYRDMTKWNAQWRLKVDIYNVTSAFAAVNVAGPQARALLGDVVSDIDLSPEAFPYLAYRETTLFGAPVRMMRVGFVGELGYELHIPAQYGEALWDHIMSVGQGHGIKPFGVEAQRLLRLEKGHIIVGQDTDGMSHPGELDLGWAVNRKKPFFVGCRSVDIMMAKSQTRKLVGFSLPSSELKTKVLKPKEGHLVLHGQEVAGHVTSCEYSPTLDRIIGLAYAAVADSSPGKPLTIRVDDNRTVNAEVVSLPFFDPENHRQEVR